MLTNLRKRLLRVILLSDRVKQVTQNSSTHWAAIWILFFAGCTLALHIGKMPAALPLLVAEFDMSLVQAGTLVSIYAVLIAGGALLCGMFVARAGYVLFAVAGVALGMIGSLGGALATNIPMLMLGRAIEGLGWVVGVVSIPIIMSTLSAANDRPVVLGLWGAFMAIGGGGMLLIAPHLQALSGWRLSWMIAAILSLLGTIAVLLVCRQHRDALEQLHTMEFSCSIKDLRQRRSVAIFFCFLCYSFQYVSITSFLPTLLVQDSAMPLVAASYWTALIILPNALGNLSAGWFINRGFKRSRILGVAAILVGLCSLVVLSIPHNSVRIVAAMFMMGIGGIIPGTLFSTVALVASTAAGAGVVIGFMLTGTGVGQLFGPVMLTRVVEWSGQWYTGGLLCLAAGLIGAFFARWLSDLPALVK